MNGFRKEENELDELTKSVNELEQLVESMTKARSYEEILKDNNIKPGEYTTHADGTMAKLDGTPIKLSILEQQAMVGVAKEFMKKTPGGDWIMKEVQILKDLVAADFDKVLENAHKEDPLSQAAIGYYLFNNKEFSKSFDWTILAAQSGHASSMFAIAGMLINELIILEDGQDSQAIGYTWLEHAYFEGHPGAIGWIEEQIGMSYEEVLNGRSEEQIQKGRDYYSEIFRAKTIK